MIATTPIRLIVGLGNPGPDYAETRHNAGFWLVDRLNSRLNGHWRSEQKFHGDVAKVMLASQEVWLLKPSTFMNHSGRAVLALAHFYKLLPNQILVVHDELDLLPGTARFKWSGGHGGHNGLKDIRSSLSVPDFWRLRIGIGHPGNRNEVINFVLKKPSINEADKIGEAIEHALDCLPDLVAGHAEAAMKSLHTAPNE